MLVLATITAPPARSRLHDRRVSGGRFAFLGQHLGAGARDFAGDIKQILDADDRAVERPERNSGLRARIGGIGRGFRLLAINGQAGARALAFRIIDAGQRGLKPLAGGRWLH